MEIKNDDIIPFINKDFSLELNRNLSEDELASLLAAHINDMILHDLPKLIQLLYRVDISEKKIKQTLADNKNYEAGMIIARIIIERQKEKAKTRASFKQDFSGNSDVERW